jgi:hypothetical protein
MIVEAQYNWRGELNSYRRENSFIPLDPRNSDFHQIQVALDQGTCEVVEPELGIVHKAYDRNQQLSGYLTRFGFVPIDQDNYLYRLIKEQITDGRCSISDSSGNTVEVPSKLERLVLCTIFDQPWPHLRGPFTGELAYASHESCVERDYRFTIKNLPSVATDKLQLLLADHQANDNLPITCFPLQFGVIEIDLPVRGLKHLFMGERKMVPSWVAPALKDSLEQHYAQTRRKPSEGPDVGWLINHIGLYSGHFFVEFTNHVIDAFKREYGNHDRPMPYLTEGNAGSNPIVIGHLEDGSARLQRLASISSQRQMVVGEWDRGSLRRYQDETKSSTFLFKNALSRVSEMVRLGFHPEALTTLNAYLEVVIRWALTNCVKNNPLHISIVVNLGHRKRLDILGAIAKSKHAPHIFDDDFRARVVSAEAICKNRNSYVHAMQLPDVVGRLKLEERRKMEALFHGFLDYFEQNQFLIPLQFIADDTDVVRKIVIKAIQEKKE